MIFARNILSTGTTTIEQYNKQSIVDQAIKMIEPIFGTQANETFDHMMKTVGVSLEVISKYPGR